MDRAADPAGHESSTNRLVYGGCCEAPLEHVVYFRSDAWRLSAR